MRKLNARMIISDFDGTLADSDNGVSETVVKAINEYVAAGGIFIVCTGRMLSSILPRVRALGLKGLVAASQGSQIANIESGALIRDVVFTPEEGAKACRALEEFADNVQIYCGESFYSSLPADNKFLMLYEEIIGIKARHTDCRLSEYILKERLHCTKTASICKASERDSVYAALCERLGETYDVTCSASVLIEISPYGETKGKALKYLADRYDVPIEKTVAIGDNLNDLSMIECAGVGVAVGNGEAELKEQADFVAVSNDEFAVAQVIQKFGYEND